LKRPLLSKPVGGTGLHNLETAVALTLRRLYVSEETPTSPLTNKHIPKSERNRLIIERYERGDTLESIAADFDISVQRVHQIIQRWSN
jgi:transposase-like protein